MFGRVTERPSGELVEGGSPLPPLPPDTPFSLTPPRPSDPAKVQLAAGAATFIVGHALDLLAAQHAGALAGLLEHVPEEVRAAVQNGQLTVADVRDQVLESYRQHAERAFDKWGVGRLSVPYEDEAVTLGGGAAAGYVIGRHYFGGGKRPTSSSRPARPARPSSPAPALVDVPERSVADLELDQGGEELEERRVPVPRENAAAAGGGGWGSIAGDPSPELGWEPPPQEGRNTLPPSADWSGLAGADDLGLKNA